VGPRAGLDDVKKRIIVIIGTLNLISHSLKVETADSSETLVKIYQSTPCPIERTVFVIFPVVLFSDPTSFAFSS
jgi:hypothetical protein